jgi:hypothetical protein
MAPAYRIGKGPIIIALEAFLRDGEPETLYEQLKDEDTYLTGPKPTAFDEFLATRDELAHTHLVRDVFGPGAATLGLSDGERQDAVQRGLSRRVVYGRGLRRALEIAYGFGGEALLDEPWTIDAYWGCGQPYNLVGLRTNPQKKVVTLLIYSDEVATGDDRRTVVPQDPAKEVVPDEDGDLLIVDDREGIGDVREWRATKEIGLANSPDPVEA